MTRLGQRLIRKCRRRVEPLEVEARLQGDMEDRGMNHDRMTGMTGFRLPNLPIMTESILLPKPPHSCSMPARTHDLDLNPFVNPNLNPWITSCPGWPEQLMRPRPHWLKWLMIWPGSTHSLVGCSDI